MVCNILAFSNISNINISKLCTTFVEWLWLVEIYTSKAYRFLEQLYGRDYFLALHYGECKLPKNEVKYCLRFANLKPLHSPFIISTLLEVIRFIYSIYNMYSSNHISMGFGLCRCRACRHLDLDRKGNRTKHRTNPYRKLAYKKLTKTLRQNKFKEELPYRLFNLGSYSD